MKKKIRDLSFNEILKICHVQNCDDCPLKNTMVCVCEIAWKEEQLDQEIEVANND